MERTKAEREAIDAIYNAAAAMRAIADEAMTDRDAWRVYRAVSRANALEAVARRLDQHGVL